MPYFDDQQCSPTKFCPSEFEASPLKLSNFFDLMRPNLPQADGLASIAVRIVKVEIGRQADK
jgi:hypothetical protein